MNKIKNKDLAQLPLGELKNKLNELRKEVMKDNAQVAMRTIPKNPGLLKLNKKMIAKIINLINIKNLSEQKVSDNKI